MAILLLVNSGNRLFNSSTALADGQISQSKRLGGASTSDEISASGCELSNRRN